MSSLKTYALLALTCATLTKPVAASGELHTVFAGCVGRFSAEMEHAWLLGDPAADEFQSHRESFLSLMEATMPPGNGRAVLSDRIEHKMAHASLLTIATFSQNPRRARAAQAAARSFRLECTRLLLGG